MPETITLIGVTRHGKNRIAQHGPDWLILEPAVRPKPARLFIRSLKTGDERWLTDDFQIQE